ncbi:MAG TPA: sortase [Rubrobacteraceae bacterium]|nr:sortase [Rubrobacteraceae bacterium]
MRKLVLILAALVAVVTLAACGASEQSSSDDSGGGGGQRESTQAPDEQVAPNQGSQEDEGETVNAVEPPADEMMRLTVPKLAEIENDEIPTGLGNDDVLFRDYAAVHLKYTGFPWEEEANVYIAGHRLGFEDTNSWRAFYDLEDLKKGDEVFITDSEGREYSYKVFQKFIVEPTDLSVLAPIEGRNIVTLQTCTLPDYSDRVIIRAELEDIKEA